jgi:hypothetical protein
MNDVVAYRTLSTLLVSLCMGCSTNAPSGSDTTIPLDTSVTSDTATGTDTAGDDDVSAVADTNVITDTSAATDTHIEEDGVIHADTHGAEDTTKPQPCAVNEKVSEHVCVPCPSGEKTAEGADPTGEDTNCTPCSPGAYDAGGDTCVPCEAGSLSDSGATECMPCSAGTFADEFTCTACSDGYVSEEGQSECLPCPAGTWDNQNLCEACAKGTVSAEGAAQCISCEAGSFANANLCTECPAGAISQEGETECLACDDGSVSNDAHTACETCPAETYDDGSEACAPCPKDFTSLPGATECEVAPKDSLTSLRDYGYLFWPTNHWFNWGIFFDVQYMQSGYYGWAFDVSKASFVHLGMLDEAVSPEGALKQDATVISNLPAASLSYAAIQNGVEYAATDFLGTKGALKNPSRLIDMGRFMQRLDIPEVGYEGANDLAGSIHLAAMTRHVALTHRAKTDSVDSPVTLTIHLEGPAVETFSETTWLDGTRAVSVHDAAGKGWSFILPEQPEVTLDIVRLPNGSLSFRGTFNTPVAGQEMALSVIGVPSNAGDDEQLSVWLHPGETVSVKSSQLKLDGSGGDNLQDATWDPERGLYVVNLHNLSDVGAPGWQDWANLDIHNWYNRHRIVLANSNNGPVSIPLAFDGGNNAAFYIVGGSPLFRDLNGEPTGTPIQISKNWHVQPFWYHLYSAMTVEPGTLEVEHTFAHSKWGEAYAAAHAQLSLIGWAHNQQWDESSLGAFGETITYDPDLTAGRSMVDDVRPFLVDTKGKWKWTGNVGGANFLLYANQYTDNRPEHQLGRLRTHYKYTGPNLTHVSYAGRTRDGKIEANITTQLGRTDDLVRVYYHLHYTVLEDTSYDRLALFQMAADRYGDNGFKYLAYGNAAGATYDGVIVDHKKTGYISSADRGIELSGDAPWVMLYDSKHKEGDLPEYLANLAFVVRDYEVTIGDETTTTPHINVIRTFNGGWSQMAFELGVPYDPDNNFLPAGSVMKATVEYLVPPAVKDAYYGPSDYLAAIPAEDYQSTEMARTLAEGNQLEVVPSVGSLTRTYPVVLEAAPGATAVQFTLSGGLGYTPITVRHLARPDGWKFQRKTDGAWLPLGQEVHGNDYWQAYESTATQSFDLIYNVKNTGVQEYRLVR